MRYDPRGQGLSDHPKDLVESWTPEKFAEDFEAVVDHYGLKKPFIAAWYVCRGANPAQDTPTIHSRGGGGKDSGRQFIIQGTSPLSRCDHGYHDLPRCRLLFRFNFPRFNTLSKLGGYQAVGTRGVSADRFHSRLRPPMGRPGCG